ncbi:hypothetical protein [Motilimonas eburnea]|uniref:hypothetical protein n=1 Tax=Motilimonas eburnea TaxID=1737488 RepID=UPI001E441B04|nr:hypothetical protein [Motilimonas eburnea]MCE2570246.1 hypothetical protein [Motilimonas eburnea]
MKSGINVWAVIGVLLTSWSQMVTAETTEEVSSQSLVTINVGVDLTGLEAPAVKASDALIVLSESITQLSQGEHLTDAEQQQIQKMAEQVAQLSSTLNTTVQQIPQVIEQASQPVVESSQTLLNDIKWVVILVLVALLVVLVLVLIAVYYTVLQPSRQLLVDTTEQFNKLATAMENTAKSVELSGQYHQGILAHLQQVQQKN